MMAVYSLKAINKFCHIVKTCIFYCHHDITKGFTCSSEFHRWKLTTVNLTTLNNFFMLLPSIYWRLLLNIVYHMGQRNRYGSTLYTFIKIGIKFTDAICRKMLGKVIGQIVHRVNSDSNRSRLITVNSLSFQIIGVFQNQTVRFSWTIMDTTYASKF